MLKLLISSGGRARGQMELPLPLDEFKRRIEEIRKAGQPHSTPAVCSVECSVPDLSWHLEQTKLDSDAVLQKLNQLTEAIDGMSAAGRYHLCKALPADTKQSLEDILRAAAHIKPSGMDCYEIIPAVATHTELGKWLVEHDGLEAKAPESLRTYLNFRSIGIDYCNAHEGEFLADGYVGIRSGSMERVLAEQGILHLTLSTGKGTFPLSLPASDERLEQAKRALDVEDFAQAEITAVKFSSPYLDELLPLDTVTVEEANTLALCLQEMEKEDGEQMKFCSVLEVEQPDTFTEAVRIARERDDYERVPEDMDEYGKQVLRRVGADDEVIDTIDGYMDFERLGMDSMEEDGVRRTEFGLIRRLSSPFPAQEAGQTMA
mgnify:CR=1 FL=1